MKLRLPALLILTAFRIATAGFTSGAPCNVRNTAYLSITTWRLPKEPVSCVDITSLGNTTFLPDKRVVKSATTLYADHMRLKLVPEFVIENMPNLELVDLSGNIIRRVNKKVFLKTPNLRTLLLADNNAKIPRKYPLLISPSLTSLSLSSNKIRRLTPVTFAKVPSLTSLFLDRNLLVRLHADYFKPLKHLKYLHLGNNRLKTEPSKDIFPKSLNILIVKGNPFNTTNPIK